MESASAQSAAAAAKPQSLSLPPPMAQPEPDRPPTAMTTAEMEATIAALPAKKDALRQAFDHLAACSPFPLPFTWDDLDAHISSIQSSISLRFRQLRVLEAARSAPAVSASAATGDDEKGKNHEEEESSEEEAEEEEVVVEEVSEVEEEEEEEEVANEKADEKDQKADEETEVEEEEETKKVSPVQDGVEVDEEMEEAKEEEQDAKNASPEQYIEEGGEAKKMSLGQGNLALPGGDKDLVAACASMDAARLVEIVCNSVCLRQVFPVAMRYAPDAATLILHVVRGVLPNKEPKTAKVWGNCVALIRCVREVTPELSMHMMEQAKLLAKDWKKMIDKPGSSGDLGNSASWALLYFVIYYNIVSEFDVDEIIHLFSTVPRKHQKKNCIELCEGLGLASRITDLIDYLIGNGQQLDAVHLTHVFKLVDKYPLLSLVGGYVEKARETALEIFSKQASRRSLNPAMLKEVDNLRVAQNIVKQQSTDSTQSSVVLVEIKKLLAEYAKKRSLINAPTASTSNSWQQQKQKQKPHDEQLKEKQKNKKRKKEEQEQQEGQESQLQGKQRKLQGKQEQQKTKPQEEQQQQQQNKPQENKGQKQQHKQQEKHQKQQQQNESQQRQQQNLKRPRPYTTKLPTPVAPAPCVLPPVVRNVAQVGPFGNVPYAVMPRVHTYPAQPGWPGIQSGPFGAPQYMGPYQPNPLYRPPSFYPR